MPAQGGLIWATTMATHMMAPMPFFWYAAPLGRLEVELVTACSMAIRARIEDPARKRRNACRVRP